MKKILLSINPEFVKLIFSGEKEYEFRKNVAKQGPTKIIIYSTSPVSAVVGEAVIESIIVNDPELVWEVTKSSAGIDEKFFYEYFNNRSRAVAYKLTSVIEYPKNKKLSDYGVKHAPQSFVYI